jgi:hypothetical protein
MKAILMATITVSIMLSFFLQLVVIAQDSSETALSFADSMNMQLKCTHDGIPLSECQTPSMNMSNSQLQNSEYKRKLESHIYDTQDAISSFHNQVITE